MKYVNRAKMNTSTVGTGALALGSAVAGFQSFADAGVVDGDQVRYVIEDGQAWEIGLGTYSASGPSLTRTPAESSNGGAAIALTGNAQVYLTVGAGDLNDHSHSSATASAAGFMSSADKSKLDGISAGAQVNAVTSVAGKTGAVTLAVGDVSGAIGATSPYIQTPQISGAYISGSIWSYVSSFDQPFLNANQGHVQKYSATSSVSFYFSNPSSGPAWVVPFLLILEISNNASITWPSSVRWPGNTAPTLGNGTHLIFFQTENGGNTWRGAALTGYTG